MTTEFTRRTGGEFYRPTSLSPEMLLADNRSEEAKIRLSKWQETRQEQRQILTITCSDSRIVLIDPTGESVVRGIAAGVDIESFLPAILNPNYIGINFMGHHSGERVEKGEPPKGCGGMEVKVKLANGERPVTDIEKWVDRSIEHSDLLLHLFLKAHQVLKHSDKEILLSSQDHLDKTVYPMLAFLNEPVSPGLIDVDSYDPSEIYKHGIPHLTSGQLQGSVFEAYLNTYYTLRFPTLHRWASFDRTSQLSQNPKVLLITSSIRPPEVCYPDLTEVPGEVFVITVARRKNEEAIQISDEDIESVVSQAHYPVRNFSKLSRIFIETGSFDQSKRIARRLEERDWAMPWLSSGKGVIIGQNRAGVLEQASVF